MDTSGIGWATPSSRIEGGALRRHPGVVEVEVNPVAQTATVTFDTSLSSVGDLRQFVEECGLHCVGQSVPAHICDPLEEPGAPTRAAQSREPAAHAEHAGPVMSPHEAMGHSGGAG